MSRIYIVRHGNTFDAGDLITRVGARTDLPLSRSGQAQADALAAHFRELAPGGFSAAYCSPLLRTRQTAETILGSVSSALDLETLEFLREIDYGPDENQTEEKVIARIGAAAIEAWDRRATPPAGWQVDPVQLKRDWQVFLARVGAGQDQAPILVVTSNGIARFILDAVTSIDSKLDSIKLKTGAYGIVEATANAATLTAWNLRP